MIATPKRPAILGTLGATARKAAAIFLRDAVVTMSYEISFLFNWVGIFVQVASFFFISRLIHPSTVYGYGGRSTAYFDYVVINLAFTRFQATAIQCFQNAIRDDQLAGTLEAILATPTTLPVIILSRGLWAFALTSLQVIAFILLALPLGLDLRHVNVLTVLSFVVLTVACMSPIGVLSASSVMTFKQSGGAGFIMGGLTQLLCGVLFPVSTLPAFLQIVAWWLPMTHALEGIRAGMFGAPLSQLIPDILWLSVASTVLLPISLWSFSKSVQRAQVDGTLSQY
jgi:ABC-2 type transport system permease protein